MKLRVVKWFTCSQSISGYKGKEMPHLGYSNCARPFTQGSRYFHHEHLCSKHLCYKPFHYIINWPWYNSAIKYKITENKRRTLKLCNETWKINSKIKKKTLLQNRKYLNTFKMGVDWWKNCSSNWFYLILWVILKDSYLKSFIYRITHFFGLLIHLLWYHAFLYLLKGFLSLKEV